MNARDIFIFGIKENLSSKGRALSLALIIIVPLMYPLFWLQAFWNPYSNIDKLPVAFVNEDSGAFGASLENRLRGRADVKWDFVSRAVANDGLKSKKYYAGFVIPGNFSQTVLSGQTANIEVYVDSKNNSMSAMLAGQIEKQLEETLSFQIAQNAAEKALGEQGAAFASFIANPVDGVSVDFDPVANSGTGFAPYFCSLALWIGALLISLVMGGRIVNGRLKAGGFTATVGRYAVFACAGTLQSLMLTAVVFLLGIDVAHGPLLFLALLASSLTSIAIVSSLVGIFGTFGQMLSMIVLIFQLTASGGTFPTELTEGGLFMALHSFVPFTYSINALREAVSAVSVDWTVFWRSVAVQLSVIIVFLAICATVSNLKIKKQTQKKSTTMGITA
jgi:putative membrane protein